MPTDLIDRLRGARASLAYKAPVRVATTANVTLSGAQTIDGVSVVADDRVLVRSQATESENGIYVVSSGAWSRAKDFNGNDDAVTGTRVYVHSGSTQSGAWEVTTADPVVIGTSSITFAKTSETIDSATIAALQASVAAIEADLGGTQLSNLLGVSGTGLVARTAEATYAQREITSPSGTLDISNGDGVSGDPTLDVADNSVTLARMAHGTANKYIGYNADGAPAEIDEITRSGIALIGKGVSFSGGLVRLWVDNNNYLWAVGNSANLMNGYAAGDTDLPQRVAFNVTPGTITAIRCSDASAYVLDSNGYVYSWGDNSLGQLGHNDTTNRSVATRIEYFVTNNITITAIYPSNDSSGGAETYVMFLDDEGTLWACGGNGDGQLGLGDTTDRDEPTEVTSVTGVTDVATGTSQVPHTLALTSGGTVYATGSNNTGQLGLGDTTQRTSFTEVTSVTGVTAIKAASSMSTFAAGVSMVLKSDATVWMCGSNTHGVLGQGDTTDRSSFTKITSITGIASIALCSDGRFCTAAAVKGSTQQVYVWGLNGTGQCGDGTTTNVTAPNLPTGDFQGSVSSCFVAGSNSSSGVFVLTDDDELWAAGYSAQGNLGINSSSGSVSTFAQCVGIDGTISDYYVSGTSTTWGATVLYSDGRTAVCGDNSQGQLGLGAGTNDSLIFRDVLFIAPLGVKGDAGAGYKASSTTSLAIGTGSKAFTIGTGYAYSAGVRIKASSAADTANFMVGEVASYSGGVLTVTVDFVGGSGTHADWNINIADGGTLYSTLNFEFYGGATSLESGEQAIVQVPFNCTIVEATLISTTTGSIVIDVWKDTYANYPPTDSDSITASAQPTLSSAQKSVDNTLTGWTTSIASGDILIANIDSVSGLTYAQLSLKVQRS